MPFVNIRTSAPLDAAGVKAVTDAAHKAINEVLSKPDEYIAINVDLCPNLQFGGTKAPAAMISVHSIGYGGADAKANKEALLKALGEAMKTAGNVPGDRLFVSFEDVHKDFWGFNGQLFSTIFGT
jgi:phenylpyruvate tautomerase PptA (4-oxalocrotonate tautomerase family)